MRLSTIQEKRSCLSTYLQQFSSQDISDLLHDQITFRVHDSRKRKIMRLLAEPALRLQQGHIQQKMGFTLSFDYDALAIGERFANDASLAKLLKLTNNSKINDVLIPGCYIGSEDVQFWLRQDIKRLEGVDVYSLEKKWSQIVPELSKRFGRKVNFQQASIESLPFEDESFDLICTSAVLEHVRNLTAMAQETARVLRPGGWAWHVFGPLYYCYGGDHCMPSYGFGHGYNHLILDEEVYQQKIKNQMFFNNQIDPNMPFWALNDQFSFATPKIYIDLFSQYFDIMHLVIKISDDALRFRSLYPAEWSKLINFDITEEILLTKSLALILKKKNNCCRI